MGRNPVVMTILTDDPGMPLGMPQGMSWDGNVMGRPPPVERFSSHALEPLGLAGPNVHGLRKPATANLAEAGCPTHEIAVIIGHETLSMVQLRKHGSAPHLGRQYQGRQ